jgi:uncharacterized repeat protein (TIGR02543 family)
MKARLAALAVLAAGALCAACSFLPIAPTTGRGSLVVDLAASFAASGQSASSRAVTADFRAQVARLVITVTGGDGDTQSTTVDDPPATGTVDFTDLAAGNCSVAISAYRADDLLLGSGSASFKLIAAAVAVVAVPVSFEAASGSGSFALEIKWPAASGTYAEAVLDGDADHPIVSDPAIANVAGTCSARFQAAGLASGAHELVLVFYDGPAKLVAVGYAVETVNVWNGLVSGLWVDGTGAVQTARSFSAAELFDSTLALGSLKITGLESAFVFNPGTLDYSGYLARGSFIDAVASIGVPGQRLYLTWNGAESNIDSGADYSLELSPDEADGANTLTITVFAPHRGSDPAVTRDYTVTLRQAYKVVFDLTDGDPATGDYIPEQIVAKGGLATAPTVPTRSGAFTFAGWYTDLSVDDIWDFAVDTVAGNTVLHAKWTGGVTVNFTLNPVYAAVSLGSGPVSLVLGETATFSCVTPAIAALAWTWYVDTALQADTDGSFAFTPPAAGSYVVSGSVSYGGLRYSGARTVTVGDPYSLSYSGNGATSGSLPAAPTAYAPAAEVPVAANSGGLARSGYAFAGWATTPLGAAVYDGGENFPMPLADVVLYAVWENVAPGEITGFAATGGDGYLNLSWTDPADADLESVLVEWNVAGTDYSARVGAGTQAKLILGLPNTMNYNFEFVLTCRDAEGLESAGFTATVADTVGAASPLGLTAACSVGTSAGNAGVQGADDGVGVAAIFWFPSGLCAAGGYLYVAEVDNCLIRRFDPETGTVATIAGTGAPAYAEGPGRNAAFDWPWAVASDGANLYIADGNNNRIRRLVLATGVVDTLAGSGAAAFADGFGAAASFNHPMGIATDGVYVYVADTNNQRIRRIAIATGEVATIAGGAAATFADDPIGTNARFNNPRGLETDGTNLYVADLDNNRIRRIVLATGAVSTLAGSGLAGTADGNGAAAQFSAPNDLAYDGEALYVTDCNNCLVRRVALGGDVTTVAGMGVSAYADGTGTGAGFSYLRGIALLGGRLYVADPQNHLIRSLAP